MAVGEGMTLEGHIAVGGSRSRRSGAVRVAAGGTAATALLLGVPGGVGIRRARSSYLDDPRSWRV